MSKSNQSVFCFATALLAVAGTIAAVSCASSGAVGHPAVGTARAFDASEEHVNSAITNAFGSGQYCDMLLGQAAGHDFLARGWHPTNGFLLQPGIFSPYRAYFHIVVVPLASNLTQVTVRTIKAEAVSGREPGVHGGWAFHFKTIRPIPEEEEKVEAAIAAELTMHK